MASITKVGVLAYLVIISAANEITDILIEQDTNSNDTSEGVVLLKYDGASNRVCHYGDQKNWGKREAIVACKQLGFKGGWPFDVQKTDNEDAFQHLNNFDCDESVTNLKDCGYEITGDCLPMMKLAGIQCYRTFDVQLIGGVTPNAGRVEVKYDDMWSNVCYESRQSSSRKWSFYNVQVVCKEMGFPGAMFAKQGGQGKGTQRSLVDGYKCRDDLREESLHECFPNAPIKITILDHVSSCGNGSTEGGNEAVAICASPGYIGCFGTTVNLQMEFNKVDNKMTINMCRRQCRKQFNRYAYIHNGDNCSCGMEIKSDRVGDDKCGLECRGDSDQACGAIDAYSVYDVTIGLCDDPLNQTGIYFYGDIFNDFKCDTGMELVGLTAVQCVSGDTLEDTEWNNTFPECRGIIRRNNNKGAAVGASLGCILILLIVIATVLIFLRKRWYETDQPTIEYIEIKTLEQKRRVENDSMVIEISINENIENDHEAGLESVGSFFATQKSKVYSVLLKKEEVGTEDNACQKEQGFAADSAAKDVTISTPKESSAKSPSGQNFSADTQNKETPPTKKDATEPNGNSNATPIEQAPKKSVLNRAKDTLSDLVSGSNKQKSATNKGLLEENQQRTADSEVKGSDNAVRKAADNTVAKDVTNSTPKESSAKSTSGQICSADTQNKETPTTKKDATEPNGNSNATPIEQAPKKSVLNRAKDTLSDLVSGSNKQKSATNKGLLEENQQSTPDSEAEDADIEVGKDGKGYTPVPVEDPSHVKDAKTKKGKRNSKKGTKRKNKDDSAKVSEELATPTSASTKHTDTPKVESRETKKEIDTQNQSKECVIA